MSSAVVLWFTMVSLVAAHEVVPTVIDMERDGNVLSFHVDEGLGTNIESFVVGIDLTEVEDTDVAAQAAEYDVLRALPAADLEAQFRAFWPEMASRITITAGGETITPELLSLTIPEPGNLEVLRPSTFSFSATLPDGAEEVQVGWDRAFGGLVLRQQGVDLPYDGFLTGGEMSPAIALAGGSQKGGWATFFDYIPTGFDHIVPKGLDHILFVLGLFFLSTQMRPLLLQITAFTLAHTITLALAAAEIVNVPGSIVEPLIALSIVYVAVENLYTTGLSKWRPFIIFGFGLLHGLGFASVLAEFGLPEGSYLPALIGFNIGVEIGQLAVIAVAFMCVREAIRYDNTDQASRPVSMLFLGLMLFSLSLIIPLQNMPNLGDLIPLIAIVAILFGFSAAAIAAPRYDNYRDMVAMPASILIAVVAAYWCIERVFL